MKQQETASFLIRCSQSIYQDEQSEDQIQWRGSIRHVQSGEQIKFTDFDKMTSFLEERLSRLTLEATKDKGEEEQKNLLQKSVKYWKRSMTIGPKFVLETLKDPKSQFEYLQQQFSQKIEEIPSKMDFNSWKTSSLKQNEKIGITLEKLLNEVEELKKQFNTVEKLLQNDK